MPAPAMESAPRSSKTAKKAARSAQVPESPTASSSASVAADAPSESPDDGFESPHIRDLQKNIRNLNKKLANASKTDTILSQHSGKSLDELVAAKIINADQKAQILKKPDLQAHIAQQEEQLAQHLKAKEHYQQKLARAEKAWEKSREQIKADAIREAEEAFQDTMQRNLLTLSQFLRLAAHRRGEGKDPESEESQAIEGLLIAIYSGDSNAVTAMRKLIEGSEDHIQNPPDEPLPLSYSHIKYLANEHKPIAAFEAAPAEELEASREVASDPTIAHATSNELAAGEAPVLTNGTSKPMANGIANATISEHAANAIAESHWDVEHDISTAPGWVNVSVVRDPTETETGLTATPAAPSNTQSWADEQPDTVFEAAAPPPLSAEPADGFRQVQRNRGRHERDGQGWRGRGRGEWRGRGRGDGRGRGRGRGQGQGQGYAHNHHHHGHGHAQGSGSASRGFHHGQEQLGV